MTDNGQGGSKNNNPLASQVGNFQKMVELAILANYRMELVLHSL